MSTPRKTTTAAKNPAKKKVAKKVRVKKKAAAKRLNPVIVAVDAPKDDEALKRQAMIDEAMQAAGINSTTDLKVFERKFTTAADRDVAIALSGTNTKTGEFFVEAFQCLSEVPAGVHTNLLVFDGTTEDLAVKTERLVHVVRDAVVPEQRRRYDALVFDPVRLVDIFQLAEAGSYLIEKYTGRPSVPSTD